MALLYALISNSLWIGGNAFSFETEMFLAVNEAETTKLTLKC